MKPFFSNKNLHSDDISINDKNEIVPNEVKLAELFNMYFINAEGNTTGKAPTSSGDSSNQQNDTENVKKMISEYKNRPSIPVGIYLLKVNNRNTRIRCEICSKLTIKAPEQRH